MERLVQNISHNSYFTKLYCELLVSERKIINNTISIKILDNSEKPKLALVNLVYFRKFALYQFY